MSSRRHRSGVLPLTPVAVAVTLALCAGSLNAAPRTFIGPGSFWDVVANWTGGLLPGVGDDAILGGFNTEVRSSFTINSFIGTGSLTVSAGTLSFAAASSIGALNLTGGALAGAGSLTVSGTSTWTSGQQSGAGSTTFNGATTLSGDNSRDVISRTVNFNGTTGWSNVSNGGGVFQTGSGATLANAGTFNDNNAFNTSISNVFGGPASTFVNTGTYNKTGAGTTNISIGFSNSGAVNVQTGTLRMGGGGTSTGGSYSVASGATVEFSGGTQTLTNITTGTGSGRLLASGGIVNSAGTLSFSGVIGASGGTFNFNGAATAGGFEQTGGTVGGTGSLVVSGPSIWTSGDQSGTGSTTFNGATTLSGDGSRGITSRTVNFNGTTNWANVSNGGGVFQTGSGATLANAGTFNDNTAFNTSISNAFGGPTSIFVNAGTYNKTGAATTTIAIGFNNSGTLNVNAGTLTLTSGLTNFSGTTLTGGTYNVVGASTLQFAGANVVTNAAAIRLDGAGAQFLNSSTAGSGLLNLAANTAAGSFTIRNGRNFTTLGAFNNAGIVNVGTSSTFTGGGVFTNQVTGQLQLAGGGYAGPSVANSGVVSGFGAVAPVVSNSGTVRATGGTLTLTGGALGATGTVLVDTGAALSLGATSTARNLVQNGTLLALGANNITVFNDYNNAGFGLGNSFNRRAGVSGAGQILASGIAQQTLTGALISGGNTGSATLTLPNIRVGQGGTSSSYTINNTGLGGPSLRGALVTNGISNLSLTGSGVTPQNWGAIAQSGPGQTFSVTFDPTFGQALTGQVLQVVNNFDNVAGQSLTITGQAFNLASASAATPSPVVFANQRVGGTLSQALTLSNTAPNSGFSEALNASISASGTATAAGSFSLLAAGSSSSALVVGMNTNTAGAKAGVATITLASDGTGTSGFSPLALTSQNVNVSGNVFRLATASAVTPSPVVLANQRVGGTATQALSFTNTAASDGFSEALNASIAATGTATSGGSFSLLAAGASSSALFVGVNTVTAGAKSGTANITLTSDGTGTSGFSAMGIAGQSVNVSGNVYRLATASAVSPSPVVLANQRVGGNATQALSFTNTAAADGFSESLNATIAASGTATAGGSFSLLAAGATSNALFVGVNTATAGAKSGTANIALASDGTGTSGFSALGIAGQSVNVSGNVFRLAVPQVNTTPVLMVARVGDAAPSRIISVTNNAPDSFTERLNASVSATPAAFTGAGTVTGLLANASSNALTVSLSTAAAGAFSGSASVSLVSSGAGTTGAADAALTGASVGLTGRVYAPAVAQLTTATVNFGIVRVGDVVATRFVTVGNGASGALNDSLRASISGGTAPLSTSGTVTGLVAGASNNNTLAVQLATSTAGVFSSTASVAFTSQNPDLADLGLGSGNVLLSGQVNNLAQVALSKSSGGGSFSGATTSYTLNFGDVVEGTTSLTALLSLGNSTAGVADALRGSWSGATVPGDAFTLTGFNSFSGLAAGNSLVGLSVGLGTASIGSFDRVVTLNAFSTNSSGPDFGLAAVELRLQGNVVAIPEPSTYALMLGGGLMVLAWARRRQRRAA